VSVARNFSGFQSDGLMLETALLGWLLAPRGFHPRLGKQSPPSRLVIFAMRWLLFKLMFLSGWAKAMSGDMGWREFTAMNDYYQNCPFPTILGYYAQHFPVIFHKTTVVFTLFVELFPAIAVDGQ